MRLLVWSMNSEAISLVYEQWGYTYFDLHINNENDVITTCGIVMSLLQSLDSCGIKKSDLDNWTERCRKVCCNVTLSMKSHLTLSLYLHISVDICDYSQATCQWDQYYQLHPQQERDGRTNRMWVSWPILEYGIGCSSVIITLQNMHYMWRVEVSSWL